MVRSKWFVCLVGVCALAAGFGLRSAVGQQSPPMENMGLDAKIESTIDLGPDFAGHQLRLRTITFEPGGVSGFHSHKDLPAFAYILNGHLTVMRKGVQAESIGLRCSISESCVLE